MAALEDLRRSEKLSLPTGKLWPDQIRGADTTHMDHQTWDSLSRMKDPSPMLENQVVLVTGGFSGIGEKFVVMCAEVGAKVIALDANPKIVDRYKDIPGICGIQCNITDENAVTETINTIGNSIGITKLALIAGIFPDRPGIDKPSAELFSRSMNVNCIGNTNVLYAAHSFLSSQENADRDPAIVNMLTRNLLAPSHAPYAASKAAMEAVIDHYALKAAEIKKAGGVVPRVISYYPDNVTDTAIWGATPEARHAKLLESAKVKGFDTVEEYLQNLNPVGVTLSSWNVSVNMLMDLHPVCRGRHGNKTDFHGGVAQRQ